MKYLTVLRFGKRVLRRLLVFLGSIVAVFKLGSTAAMAASMAVSLAVYALAFGLKFGLGFIVLLFMHEFGHLAASRIVGLSTTRPFFVPFVGAVISLRQAPINAKMEANIAIGGPAAGTLSALLCLAFYLWTDNILWLVLTLTACLLNLFNLIPCGPLDGGRIAVAISPHMWWLGTIILGIMVYYTYNIFILIIFIFSMLRLWGTAEEDGYYHLTMRQRLTVAWWYFGLLIVLGATTFYVVELLR